MNDYCEKTAAQILVVAFTDPDAKARIADLLKMTFMEGQMRGVKEAQQVIQEAFEGRGS